MKRKTSTQEKDDADIFREQSLKAIRRRKYAAKITEWILYIAAVSVVALAIFAYFIDE